MKSKKITCLILTFLSFSYKPIKAQYVTIPDANFVVWLTAYFPTCMNGNQMDTTCSNIVNATSLTMDYDWQGGMPYIYDLTGLEYFDNLQNLSLKEHNLYNINYLPSTLLTLNLTLNQLTSLPPLPPGLTSLICGDNNLSGLPTLPTTLTLLDCQQNSITSLPALPQNLNKLVTWVNPLTSLPTLPNSLTWIDCRNNLLTSLPTLPNALIHLASNNNQLSSLPALPNTLEILTCDNNLLTALPTLSSELTILSCNNNNLTNLPALPANLTNLLCNNNLLTSLPSLPPLIATLDCSFNQLTALPTLPNSLKSLNCWRNQISNLPTLPNYLVSLVCTKNLLNSIPALPNTLTSLKCDSNNISCLPLLPNITNANNLNISMNPLTCLPNYIQGMNAATLAIPLCVDNDLTNNPNGCPQAKGILGNIYKDANNNCTSDANDKKIKNVKVKFYNPITNQFGATYSASNGAFNYAVNPGTYFTLVDTLNKPYTSNCSFPGIDSTIITTASNPLAANVKFDVKCKTGLDVSVQSIAEKVGMVFPGQEHVLEIMTGDPTQWYGLSCGNGSGGQVQITVTGPVVYNGTNTGALIPNISGNVYTYTISNFDSLDIETSFQLKFLTNTNAQAGDQICVNALITTNNTDVNPANNVLNYCYSVLNSLDPNYKEVFPKDVLPGFEDWLTFTIHFQNTGTAAAINIKLIDTLDSNLAAETFEVINYSHYNTVSLIDGVLDFNFLNILLPDSSSDLAGSQGFVQYRIKPVSNLLEGTQIKNTANIYFDYNAPITTNTTVNNFITTVGVNEKIQVPNIFIYPNPSTGVFNLSATTNVEVYNIVGELISTLNNAKTIDLSNEPNGIYFVKLNGTSIKKLIKK